MLTNYPNLKKKPHPNLSKKSKFKTLKSKHPNIQIHPNHCASSRKEREKRGFHMAAMALRKGREKREVSHSIVEKRKKRVTLSQGEELRRSVKKEREGFVLVRERGEKRGGSFVREGRENGSCG